MNHQRKIIVISFDGLGTDDWKTISKMPGFARFMKGAAYCDQVQSVYPTLTYPAHCSIATGRLPVHHRVVQNLLLQPNRMASPDWYWKRSYIQGKTIYEAAKEKGLKTASFLWPVTAGAKIDYHVPEIFANRKWDHQILASLRSGSKKFQAELFLKFGKLMQGIKEPYLDNFIQESVKYTLKKYEPDLTLIHFVDLDNMRHQYGHNSKEALMALKRHDQRLSELMDLMEGEPVTWVLLGDHSSLDYNKCVRLNVLLQQLGYVTAADDGINVKDYRVLAQEGDGSAYIYAHPSLSEEEKNEIKAELKTLLQEFSTKHENCIEAVFTGEEAGALGADERCLLMLEAKVGYSLLDTLKGAVVDENAQPTKATHGYLPTKPGYTTVFAMKGDNIRPGQVDISMSLIDEGPTIARIFEGKLPEADGRVCEEFFIK
ncbi:MAG: alkaline phosphatase family protein [Firmicutes bacterium]|nr:alkaline phosphatase family protein [Bacillota bacterium]